MKEQVWLAPCGSLIVHEEITPVTIELFAALSGFEFLGYL